MTQRLYAAIPVVACAWATLQASVAMAADPVFADPISLGRNNTAFTGGALATAAGDLDNDGRVEFISATSRSSPDAHFRAYRLDLNTRAFDVFDLMDPALIDDPTPQRQDRFGGDLSVGDVDNDGFLDIIVPESNAANGSGRVSWFKNPNGNLGGTWTEHVISTWSGSGSANQVAHLSEIVVGDIDGNGRLDVVTRDISHGFFVSLQNTDGTWASRQAVATNPREGLTLFNPDGDGDLDILLNGVWYETTDAATGSYTQRAIPGAEAWYPAVNNADTVSDYASQVEVGDFNGDGRDDMMITNSEELTNATSTSGKPLGIQLFLAPEDPANDAWTKVTLATDRFSWHSLEIGDVDLDGDLDIVTGIALVGQDVNSGEKIVAYLNDGDGLSFNEFLIDNEFMYSASLGDIDGDGDLDLIAPEDWRSGPIHFYENLTAVPEPSSVLAMLGLGVVCLTRRRRKPHT